MGTTHRVYFTDLELDGGKVTIYSGNDCWEIEYGKAGEKRIIVLSGSEDFALGFAHGLLFREEKKDG